MELAFDDTGHVAGTMPNDTVNLGHYMMLADTRLNLFTVFDDLKYDRSDIDIMSPAMRRHAVDQLGRQGFKQVLGTVLHNKAEDIRCYIPKFHALGSSPFDITRYTAKRDRDYYILTPTQTACQFIDGYPLEDAVEKVEALVQKQPINLFKLIDYLEHKKTHQDFIKALGHIKAVQHEAVTSEPLCRRKALGSLMGL